MYIYSFGGGALPKSARGAASREGPVPGRRPGALLVLLSLRRPGAAHHVRGPPEHAHQRSAGHPRRSGGVAPPPGRWKLLRLPMGALRRTLQAVASVHRPEARQQLAGYRDEAQEPLATYKARQL